MDTYVSCPRLVRLSLGVPHLHLFMWPSGLWFCWWFIGLACPEMIWWRRCTRPQVSLLHSCMPFMTTDLDPGQSCKGSGSPGNDNSSYARYSNPSKAPTRTGEPDEVRHPPLWVFADMGLGILVLLDFFFCLCSFRYSCLSSVLAFFPSLMLRLLWFLLSLLMLSSLLLLSSCCFTWCCRVSFGSCVLLYIFSQGAPIPFPPIYSLSWGWRFLTLDGNSHGFFVFSFSSRLSLAMYEVLVWLVIYC